MIYCYFQLCFEDLICILSAKLFLPFCFWLGWGVCRTGFLSLAASQSFLWRGREEKWTYFCGHSQMCLCVAKSPVLEADGEFKQQLHKSPKTIQVWSGRPRELAHVFGRGSSVEAWWGKPLTLGTLWRCLFFSSAGQCNGLPWHCGPVQWQIWCVCASQS